MADTDKSKDERTKDAKPPAKAKSGVAKIKSDVVKKSADVAKAKSGITTKKSGVTKTESNVAEAEPGGGGKTPVMFSASVDMAHSRKYNFDGTGVCKVTAKIVAVPPPSAFLEWLQDSLVGAKD